MRRAALSHSDDFISGSSNSGDSVLSLDEENNAHNFSTQKAIPKKSLSQNDDDEILGLPTGSNNLVYLLGTEHNNLGSAKHVRELIEKVRNFLFWG